MWAQRALFSGFHTWALRALVPTFVFLGGHRRSQAEVVQTKWQHESVSNVPTVPTSSWQKFWGGAELGKASAKRARPPEGGAVSAAVQ
jgi:hypothetical protein